MKTPATPLDAFSFPAMFGKYVKLLSDPLYAVAFMLWAAWTAWQLQTELVWNMFAGFVVSYAGWLAYLALAKKVDFKKIDSRVMMVVVLPLMVFLGIVWMGVGMATIANIFLFAKGILSFFLSATDATLGGVFLTAAGILFVAAKANKMI